MTQAEESVHGLLRLLDLDEVGVARLAVSGTSEDADGPSERGMRVFSGESQRTPHERVFGGQVLAQCVMAAGRTVAEVAPARRIHSLHAYFVRPGDSALPIRFAVEDLRDGSSFSVRRVHALQHGKAILSMTTSFQEPADGLAHQDPMPDVPAPEQLPPLAEAYGSLEGPKALARRRRLIDLRHVEGHLFGPPPAVAAASQHVWLRAVTALPDDDLINAAVLAFASDYTLLEVVLRRHRLGWDDPRLRVASLDHAMWFHRPARMDDWLLYAEHSPSASGGRGLGRGQMFARDGALVASVAQEGMVRVKGE
ncbi:MAG: acyl-CoA thioesterase II [Tetrasphaera sp.]